MRQEITQVKREAQFHIHNAEKMQTKEHIETRKRKQGKEIDPIHSMNDSRTYQVIQRETEDEILAKKQKGDITESDTNIKGGNVTSKKKHKRDIKKKSAASRQSFLKNIFSAGVD